VQNPKKVGPGAIIKVELHLWTLEAALQANKDDWLNEALLGHPGLVSISEWLEGLHRNTYDRTEENELMKELQLEGIGRHQHEMCKSRTMVVRHLRRKLRIPSCVMWQRCSGPSHGFPPESTGRTMKQRKQMIEQQTRFDIAAVGESGEKLNC